MSNKYVNFGSNSQFMQILRFELIRENLKNENF